MTTGILTKLFNLNERTFGRRTDKLGKYSNNCVIAAVESKIKTFATMHKVYSIFILLTFIFQTFLSNVELEQHSSISYFCFIKITVFTNIGW